MDKVVLDLYTDYLVSSVGQVTATGLASLLDGSISHDRISRFLASEPFGSADLWRLVKPLVRQVQCEDAVLIIDDSVEAKPYTDESELICWHFDHTVGKSVKGINLMSALYQSSYQGQEVSLPVAFELIKKPDIVTDPKTGREKRQGKVTKNELFRSMLQTCVHNQLPFRYVLSDAWFSATENMVFIKQELVRDFILPLKSNRRVALSEEDKKQGRYVTLSSLEPDPDATTLLWLEGVPFALLMVRQVFKNEDGSEGIQYLVSSDTGLSAERMTTIYQKRWKVEEYHKSLKSNLALAKSPTKTIRTQCNHVFATVVAFVKMERLKFSMSLNHFAIKAKLQLAAVKAAYQQLQAVKQFNCLPA